MIRVISLVDAAERRKYVEEQLAEAEIDFEFFEAFRENCQVVSEELVEEERREIATYKLLFGKLGPLNAGEIGCATSHVSLLRDFLDSTEEWLCVLEDDIVLDDMDEFRRVLRVAFSGKLSADFIYLGAFRRTIRPTLFQRVRLIGTGVLRILRHLPSFSCSPRVFLLYALQSIREVYPLPTYRATGWMNAGVHDGSHAYMVSRKAAHELVRWNRNTDFRADELLGFAQFSKQLTIIIPEKSIVSQRADFQSQIGNDPSSREP